MNHAVTLTVQIMFDRDVQDRRALAETVAEAIREYEACYGLVCEVDAWDVARVVRASQVQVAATDCRVTLPILHHFRPWC